MAFWALKTRYITNGVEILPEDYWQNFLERQIIAIGWGEIDISGLTGKEDIRHALKSVYNYTDKEAIPTALTIYSFFRLNLRDRLLLCEGPCFNFSKKIRLLGTAKITGPVEKGQLDKRLVFQRNADVEEFPEDRREMKKEELTGLLRRGLLYGRTCSGPLLLTLQEITREGFESVFAWVNR